MKDYENEITPEEMSYELDLMMQGMLYFAGVKKDRLLDACDIYIENIDDVLENSKSEGVDEVIEVVEFMKKNYKELFK
ncbi:cell division protein [Campylobacter hyointestinalis]|uniref:Cell division protein n=1 Tax=Campylobacter hyointestinalis subsp. hyointestinalis TaxID=91352 RepID=A0A2S5J726_CAMHY|nr:hypothetical protein [Campylobacter hyointestinalis]ANE32340.1 hypothetical protein CHH_0659 [Campylobacter hyointestinalis subsp. hyointestinalis LMG 9260]KEA44289.1 cell division protein [Campylobacter hyointestinalis subsp. hyointestinalis]MBT0612460.1 hypothetical protein [Campylobacter hyointestinalis subsp. hyointestinalis]MDL2346554.1 hypothetical protein [Campylobacter hyointestinalis]MDL2348835.1 hypothetical protein [Campylobacter hyointestinalis]